MADAGLPEGARLLACLMWAPVHSTETHPRCWRTRQDLAEALGKPTDSAVRRWLQQLTAKGWIARAGSRGWELRRPRPATTVAPSGDAHRRRPPSPATTIAEPGDHDSRIPPSPATPVAPDRLPPSPGGIPTSPEPATTVAPYTPRYPNSETRRDTLGPAPVVVEGGSSGHIHELDVLRRTIAAELGAELPNPLRARSAVEGIDHAVRDHGWDTVRSVFEWTLREHARGEVPGQFVAGMFVGCGFDARLDAWRKREPTGWDAIVGGGQ